jgi:hypothetical protein
MANNPKTSFDYVAEIRSVWKIASDAISLQFTYDPTLGFARTTRKRVRDGGIMAEVSAPDTNDYETIVFHEGAHVYLMTLNYPAVLIERSPTSMFDCYDFLNEYYTITLELEKTDSNKQARAATVKKRMMDILNTKRILFERTAYNAAVYIRVLEDLGEPNQDLRDLLFKKICDWKGPEALSVFRSLFFEVLKILEAAPRIQNRRFSDIEAAEITELLNRACSIVYQGTCKLMPPDLV